MFAKDFNVKESVLNGLGHCTSCLQKIWSSFVNGREEGYAHVFRTKTWWELLMLSCIMCGVEICYSAETAFVSPLLLSLGIDMEYMTLVWCISPILGFFLTPLIGSISDTCKSQMGRRRPFIILYSVGIMLGLIFVPFGKYLGVMMGDQGSGDHPRAIVLTIIGSVLMDFCCDACQSPARAYLLDVTIPKDHARGLSYFTIMAGIGGFIGAIISGIRWEDTFLSNYTKDHLIIIFMTIFVLFIATLLITVGSFKEIPKGMLCEVTPESTGSYSKFGNNALSTAKGKDFCLPKSESSITATSLELQDFEVVQESAFDSEDTERHLTFGEYIKSIPVMPSSLLVLNITQLISWMSVLCFCLYFTDFVGESVFQGTPNPNSPLHYLFKAGVQFGCWGVAVFCLTCAIYSLVIEKLIEALGARKVYTGGLMVHSIGTLGMALLKSRVSVVVLSAAVGLQYSSMLTLPYIIVAYYHNIDPEYKGKRGLGTDISIISSMVFLGQFLLSSMLGSLVKFTGTSDSIMYAATFLGLLACVCANFIKYHNL